MKFRETKLKGAFLIEPEQFKDNRGFFTKTFCKKQFQQAEIAMQVTERDTSYNKLKGTIRGMHYQKYPFEQAKLVKCTKGSIQDVIIDLRDYSQTRLRYYSKTLTAENNLILYIPKGFAHGFQTLEDNTEVEYLMDGEYNPSSERGILWDDPRIEIKWPINENITLSKRDKTYTPIEERKCLHQ